MGLENLQQSDYNEYLMVIVEYMLNIHRLTQMHLLNFLGFFCFTKLCETSVILVLEKIG